MRKGFDRVYKQIQPNFTYPFTNIKCVVPPHSLFASQHDSTNDCGITIIPHKKNVPVLNLTTTTQVYSDRKMITTHSILQPPRKYIHGTPEINETTTPTNPVQVTGNSHL